MKLFGDNDAVIRRVDIIKALLIKINRDEVKYGNDRRFVNMTPFEIRVSPDETSNTGHTIDKLNTIAFKSII